MDGIVLESPGFCYNRAVDFICYIWVQNPSAIVHDAQQIVEHGQPGPGVYAHDPDANPSWEYYPSPDVADYGDDIPFHQDNATNISDPSSEFSDYGDDYGDYYDYDSQQYIIQTLSPLFLLVGGFGNILSAVVMYRLSKELLSTCLYLAVLPIMELSVVLSRCGNDWLKVVSGIDVTNAMMMNSLSVCKVYPFTFSFVFHMMRWLLVCLAVEGALTTTRPHRLRKSGSTSRVEAVILLLTVLLVCFNMHFFWSFELVKADEEHLYPGIMCQFNMHSHQGSELFTRHIWPILDTVVTDGLPLLTVTICAIVMLVQIIRGHHHGNEAYQAWRTRYQMDPQALDQLLVLFTAVCLLFIPMNLPKMVFNLANYYHHKDLYEEYDYGSDYMDYSEDSTPQWKRINSICTNIEFCFLTFKFFLYVAISPRFRSEIKNLVNFSHCKEHLKFQRRMKHTESMANEPLVNQDGCQRSTTDTSLYLKQTSNSASYRDEYKQTEQRNTQLFQGMNRDKKYAEPPI